MGGNLKYERSVRRERQLVNEARKNGAIAARSAGSHSPIDVWVFTPLEHMVEGNLIRTGHMDLIQVKTKKGGYRTKILKKTVYHNVRVEMYTISYY